MNRIKALEILKNINVYGYATEVEKQIDEAIKELEDLENRSCSNCKHYKIYPTTKEMFCNNEKTKIGFRQCDTEKDFCCNRWENKQ